MHDDEEAPPPVEVPHASLAPDVLERLIESFVLREGTDYGTVGYALADKVAQVKRQLERGTARIMFDPSTESVTIVPAAERGMRPSA